MTSNLAGSVAHIFYIDVSLSWTTPSFSEYYCLNCYLGDLLLALGGYIPIFRFVWSHFVLRFPDLEIINYA